MTNIESLFRNADPIVSEILNNALSEKEVSIEEGLTLYKTSGIKKSRRYCIICS
jgi:FO synthase subunit 2